LGVLEPALPALVAGHKNKAQQQAYSRAQHEGGRYRARIILSDTGSSRRPFAKCLRCPRHAIGRALIPTSSFLDHLFSVLRERPIDLVDLAFQLRNLLLLGLLRFALRLRRLCVFVWVVGHCDLPFGWGLNGRRRVWFLSDKKPATLKAAG
jgi:hypothetical protein